MRPFTSHIVFTHHICRGKVCVMCFQKGSSPTIIHPGSVLLSRIQKYFLEDYDPTNQKLPNSICSRCRNLLFFVEKGKMSKDDLPNPDDFSQLDFGGRTG